jgi:hypothetical protein
MNYDIDIWSRGVDREIFNPGRRDMEWDHRDILDQSRQISGLPRRVKSDRYPKLQFGIRDRGHHHIPPIKLGKTFSHFDRLMLDQVDTDVGIQQISRHQSASRSA